MTTRRAAPAFIRQKFAGAMSDMYQREVPLYKTLVNEVEKINQSYLNRNQLNLPEFERMHQERHGAIRVASSDELHDLKRLFAIMGMQACGYYDLSQANLPVHSTVFRPITKAELSLNPFRVFTSLLRMDLMPIELKDTIENILKTRKILNEDTLNFIRLYEERGFLTVFEVPEFISAAIQTFKWHQEALIPLEVYLKLDSVNPLVADILGFKGPHINHLTPRVYDIDLLFDTLVNAGINMTPKIQGPPKRKYNILLRQTSFKALKEDVLFRLIDGNSMKHGHRARFGEVESRGISLTPKGMQLYFKHLKSDFKDLINDLPDTLEQLYKDELIYVTYKKLKSDYEFIDKEYTRDDLWDLYQAKVIDISPIIYEDFLPASAAGIFKSNLDSDYLEKNLSNRKGKVVDKSNSTEKQDNKENSAKNLSNNDTLNLAYQEMVSALKEEPLNIFKLYYEESHKSYLELFGLH
jgi:uncharacterized glyoxalase superfamily metalloenzyme YdcJ